MRFAALALLALLPCAALADSSAQEPDFSGVWGRNTIDFLQPKSGPGPVKNISGSARMMVGDYNAPILKPWAADIVKKNGEISRTGFAFPTAHNQCWPEPTPYIMGNQELQMLQKPGEVVLMYSHGGQVRRVRINGTHPQKVMPSWYGDSVGHYEGDTLVVDTVGIAVKPLSSMDRYGTPHTEAVHVVERYRLVDPNSTNGETEPARGAFREGGDDIIDRSYKGRVLQVDFTVEDPGAFNMGWSGTVVYRRAKGVFIEDICAENIHDYITGRDSSVPTAKTARISGD